MTKLEPCPFCGGKAEIHNCGELVNTYIKLTGYFGVHCTKCYSATKPYKGEEEAVKAWNKRYDPGDYLEPTFRFFED